MKPDRARMDEARRRLAERGAARAAAARSAIAAKRKQIEARRPPRRRGWMLVLLVLLLLLLAWWCSGGPGPEPLQAPGADVTHDAGAEPARAEEVFAEPARVPHRPRPDFVAEAPEVLPWLAPFRMQVAARSPRLSACFVGADRPGQLRWTTSVEPVEGRVSDHELEPMLLTGDLTREERACVVGVLEAPKYRLPAGGVRATPSRVALVLEF